MKIFFYINKLSGGGAERVVANLSSSFSSENCDVAIIVSYRTNDEYTVNKMVKRFYLEQVETENDNMVSRNRRRISRLRKILKTENPDVLISFMAEPNYRNLIATIGLKTKSIISIRNDPRMEYRGAAGKFLSWLLLPTADACVFQTEDAKKWFSLKLQRKSLIIFNAVSDEFYKVKRTPNPFEIVACGRLAKQKNYPVLFDAFRSVRHVIPEVTLKIYGMGPEEQYLKRLVRELSMKENIIFMGQSNNIPYALSTASVFVLSSDFEGMPNSLMEAMAVGLPCISTDCPCGGPRALIKNEKNGLLVPVGDSHIISEHIIRLISDKKLANNLGEKAKETALLFKADNITKQWISLIDSISHNN